MDPALKCSASRFSTLRLLCVSHRDGTDLFCAPLAPNPPTSHSPTMPRACRRQHERLLAVLGHEWEMQRERGFLEGPLDAKEWNLHITRVGDGGMLPVKACNMRPHTSHTSRLITPNPASSRRRHSSGQSVTETDERLRLRCVPYPVDGTQSEGSSNRLRSETHAVHEAVVATGAEMRQAASPMRSWN